MNKSATKSSARLAPGLAVSRELPVLPKLRDSLRRNLSWSATGDVIHPWKAKFGNQSFTIRLNDFPDEQMYTLLVNNREIGSFGSYWPANWKRPSRLPVAAVGEIVRQVAQNTGITKAKAAKAVGAILDGVGGSKGLMATNHGFKSKANARRSAPEKSIAG